MKATGGQKRWTEGLRSYSMPNQRVIRKIIVFEE